MANLIDLTGLSRFLAKCKELFLLKSEQLWQKVGNGIKYGSGNMSAGKGSIVHGEATQANGYYSHAEGSYTSTSSDYSHAEGVNTKAIGEGSHTEGCNTKADDEFSHAEGSDTNANGYYSHAEGSGTTANGGISHAEGGYTQANGYYCHAEGSTTQANGTSSHAEGRNTQAGLLGFLCYYSDNNSFYFEDGHVPSTVKVNDYLSLSFGGRLYFNCSKVTSLNPLTVNSLPVALAEDNSVRFFSTSKELFNTEEKHSNPDVWSSISGHYSHAEGGYTITYNDYEHAEGRYNKSNAANINQATNSGNTLHSVGIGTSDNNRKNAFEIMQNGDMYIIGIGGYNGKNAAESGVKTLQQILIDAGLA